MTPRRLFWFCCVIVGFSGWAGCRKADPQAATGTPPAGAGPRTVLNYGNGTEPHAASVYPREVVKSALRRQAAALIFAHNHPSGIAEPSEADRQLTNRLRDALALIDVRVLDHFVIGEGAPVSFAERGWL